MSWPDSRILFAQSLEKLLENLLHVICACESNEYHVLLNALIYRYGYLIRGVSEKNRKALICPYRLFQLQFSLHQFRVNLICFQITLFQRQCLSFFTFSFDFHFIKAVKFTGKRLLSKVFNLAIHMIFIRSHTFYQALCEFLLILISHLSLEFNGSHSCFGGIRGSIKSLVYKRKFVH